jgi:exosome complex RNA-binding protein Csl4
MNGRRAFLVALTCPNCGNTRTFLVKTLQMHVVQVDGDRVDVAEEGRPGVIECLCDECDTTLVFDEIEDATRREILLATGAR